MVIKSWRERWPAYWAAKREQQFPRLAIHFFEGFFTSDMAADSDNSLSIGAILAMLAVPGFLLPVFLSEKYSTLRLFLLHQPRFNVFIASIPDRFFFVNFAVAVTGIVTVLKWDSLFPDRRDFANLAVLPVPLRRLLYAKASALAFLIVLFTVDINVASTIVFPFVVVVSMPDANTAYYLTMALAHGVSMVLASLFTFFFFLALAGLLMSLLPAGWFQRISRYVRLLAIVVLLVQFLTSFALSGQLNTFRAGSFLDWLPPVWFTGLAQALMGYGGNPHLVAMGAVAWRAASIAFLTASVCYFASYRRYFMRIPETLDIPTRLKRRSGARLARWTARLVARDLFERACVQFSLWTLVRSEKHSLFLGAYLGLGLTLAGETPADAALILAFFLLTGLRVLFDMPAELRANWTFQVAAEPKDGSGRNAARKVMLALTLGPLALVELPVSGWRMGWTGGLLHSAFLALVFVLLANLLLVGYTKIPFTCSRVPGKRNPAIGFAAFLAGVLVFVSWAGRLDRWILERPWRLAIVAAAGLLAWRMIKPKLEELNGNRRGVIYEEEREPAVRTLSLA